MGWQALREIPNNEIRKTKDDERTGAAQDAKAFGGKLLVGNKRPVTGVTGVGPRRIGRECAGN